MHPRLVQHLRAQRHRGGENASTAARSAAAKAMCDSRKPSPESNSPIQKSGFPGVPYPMATLKSISRLMPKGASTVS
jgi:hypothetical protein